MSLYSISGVGCDCSGCGYIGASKKRKAKRQARKQKRQARKTALYCKGARVKSVVLAPARNAFLALVRLNVKKLALKLYANLKNPEKKRALFQKWCKLGGKAQALETAVLKAYNKYSRKRGKMGYMDIQPGEIGSVATLLASALPILKALAPFLKQILPQDANESSEETQPEEQQSHPQTDEQTETASAEVGAIQVNPWLIGGAGLLAYMLLRKKK